MSNTLAKNSAFSTLVCASSESSLLNKTSTTTSIANPISSSKFDKKNSNQASLTEKKTAQQLFEENKLYLQALKNKVEDIQLPLVMHLIDAIGGQDGKRNKYKVEGLGNIELTGQKWFCWNQDKGGIGPINLLMWAKKMSFSQAVHTLAKEFDAQIDDSDIKAAKDDSIVVKKSFDPPFKVDKNIEFVKHYLHYVRAIPLQLIDELIKEGSIYADEHRNCVFYAKGIAELRSSFDGDNVVKKLVDGSTRNDCFTVQADPAFESENLSVAICESAIDAMSYRTLNPSVTAASSSGAGRDFPRKFADTLISNDINVIAAFDADEAGDRAAQSLFNHFFLKKWLANQASAHNIKITDDDIFDLLDSQIVDSVLVQRPEEEKQNIYFFNQPNPFENPKLRPVILLNISKNKFNLPPCEQFPIFVTPQSIEFIQKMGLKRDRPTFAKDWNAELKQLRLSNLNKIKN